MQARPGKTTHAKRRKGGIGSSNREGNKKSFFPAVYRGNLRLKFGGLVGSALAIVKSQTDYPANATSRYQARRIDVIPITFTRRICE